MIMIIDTTTILASVIAAVPPTIVATASLIVSWRNGRTIKEVQKSTDGMKDELVRVTRSDAEQTGHAAGMAEEKAKTADVPTTVLIDDSTPIKVQVKSKE